VNLSRFGACLPSAWALFRDAATVFRRATLGVTIQQQIVEAIQAISLPF
jgi:hypothetical protein